MISKQWVYTCELLGRIMSDQKEGRFFERKSQQVDIILGSKCKGKTINLSLSGMLCSVNKFVKRGSRINITLSCLSKNLKLKGICTRCEKLENEEYIVAINFDSLDPNDNRRSRLIECIEGMYET